MNKEEVRETILQTLHAALNLQLRAVRQLLDEEELPPMRLRSKGRRRQSLVDLSLNILTEKQRPMHVNEIVQELQKNYGRITDRDTISSALAKKARKGILLRQCAPATFEALEQKNEKIGQ